MEDGLHYFSHARAFIRGTHPADLKQAVVLLTFVDLWGLFVEVHFHGTVNFIQHWCEVDRRANREQARDTTSHFQC